MDGVATSKLVGNTYPQLRYFVKRIDALPKKDTSQGHEHEFTYLDIVYLKLAAMMRADMIRLDYINDAISLVEEARRIEIKIPGTLIYMPDIYKSWFPEKIFIEPLKKGRWLWTPLSFRWAENMAEVEASENIMFVDHIPGMLYSISAIVREVNKLEDYQLELSLITDNKVVMNEA